jgi:hypothetical protein
MKWTTQNDLMCHCEEALRRSNLHANYEDCFASLATLAPPARVGVTIRI